MSVDHRRRTVVVTAGAGAIGEAGLRRIVDVNLFGIWRGMHVLGRSLRQAGNGAIVNFFSTQAVHAKQRMGVCAASKWGVRGLTKPAALEFARDGIRVVSIHSGPINTEMASSFDPAQCATMPIALPAQEPV